MNNYKLHILSSYVLSRYFKYQDDQANLVASFYNQGVNYGTSSSPSSNEKSLRLQNSNRKKHTTSLTALAKGAGENLISVRTVFPFVLFADTLKIDRQKLTIVHNEPFRSSRTASIRLKDLRNVQADIGPLFGSITITSKQYLNNTQTIKYIKRKDIIEAQRLLQGFMIAHEAQIDTDNIEKQQLMSLLNKLGRENL